MRRIIDTNELDYREQEVLESLLNIQRLPRLIVIETVEEEK